MKKGTLKMVLKFEGVALIGHRVGYGCRAYTDLWRVCALLQIYESAPVIALYIVAGSEAAEQFSAYCSYRFPASLATR